ncbi:MAG: DUF4384 domain-containing protein [Pseudomonadota bacterium]|nr:DUF4384 domain-containing protein [Pseudomonadota bacterium]
MTSLIFRFAPTRLFACLCLLSIAAGAQALEGNGYGADADEAQRRAAADLAAAIQVRINSVVESCTQVANRRAEDCGSRVLNRTATDLPLLGLRYRELPGGYEPAGAKALLEQETSAALYRDKLSALNKEFAAGSQILAGTKDRKARHALLERQIGTLRAIADHRLVAIPLGIPVEELPASESALASEREALEETVDSIAFAARVLLKGLNGRLQEAEPLTASSSREATPLGVALADALRAEMSGRSGPRLRLAGEYRLLDNGDVDVVLELRNEVSREFVGVRSVRLARAGYAGYRAEPLAPDFEKLLRQGEAVSGDLRADLVTTVGARQLKFKAGESLKLAARLNRAGYFYVVGHIVRKDGQFSYLLPLQDGAEKDVSEARFIRYVPADQANHYIELGEFSIEPPFGTEHLQIIASTQPPKDMLPASRFDPVSGYYVIQGSSGDAKKGLALTRGLKPKPDAKAMVAEGTLTFTTSER